MQSNVTNTCQPKAQTWISAIENSCLSVEKIDSVSLEQYQTFLDKYLMWYTLSDKTLGQAFCQHFDIQDDVLWYLTTYTEDRIRQLWIRPEDKLAMFK